MTAKTHSRRRVLQAIAATALVGGCASGPEPAFESGSARLDHRLRGEGNPPVVFEAGLGEDFSTFEPIAKRLSSTTTTLIYSRAGYGDSPDAQGLRSSMPITTELRALLDQTGVRPPFVLVAHSLGAIYAETYARRFPEDVAGLILLDPPIRELDATIEQDEPDKLPLIARLLAPAGMKAEWNARRQAFDEMAAAGPFPNIPFTVVSGARTVEGAPADLVDEWMTAQANLARQSPQGRHVIAERSGHYIHDDQPALVIGEIETMLAGIHAELTLEEDIGVRYANGIDS